MWNKVKGWKGGFLSRAGKEVLIKAVAQSIPTYIMASYRILDSCCKEIENMLANFWWGSKEGEKKIHWMRWDRMAYSKQEVGLGFREIKDFNTGLLGKKFWRLMQEDGSLLERFFKGRYYPRCKVSEAPIGFKPSYAWRSILSEKEVVLKGSMWRVGNGYNIPVWKDNRVSSINGFKQMVWQLGTDLQAKVSDFIDFDLGKWNSHLVQEKFIDSDAQHILSIPLSRSMPKDKIIWHYEKEGEYSVKSSYKVLRNQKQCLSPGSTSASDSACWKTLWKVPNG